MPELHYLTLTEVATRIAARELSPVDVVEHMLERIERVDAELGAYARVTGQLARREAREAEAALASGRRLGPLHGVPLAVKDLCDTAGVETAAGMAIFAGRVPTKNATVVQRLLDAGAILLGKLKTTEGAGILHHPSIAAPINPWDAAAWCGASSSGSGVATAAGLCFGSLGTDTAGSIRLPSACNGVVGLKPTFGRVSVEGIFPLAPSLDHVGPMTRSVRDAARMLSVLARPGGSTSSEDFEAALESGIRGLRIGIDEAYCSRGVDSTLSEAVLTAARHLESLGAELVPVSIVALDDAMLAFAVIFHWEAAKVHVSHHAAHAAEYGPHFRGVIEVGQRMTAAEHDAAEKTRIVFRNELVRLLGRVDAMICPPAMTAPPPAELMLHVPEDFRQMAMALRYTAPYDLAGVPTLTMPSGFTRDDVPLACQLVAGPSEEAMLLRIGHAYEQSTGWHHRHPRA